MENLQRGGCRVAWLGVGAPDAIGSGIAALQTAVTQFTNGTITNPGGAVAALLAAGTVAVSSVGPAIDELSGNDPTVMGATHLAWVDNDKLSRVNSGSTATQDDVTTAKNLALDMVNQYQVAQRLAMARAPKAAGSAQVSRRASTPPTTPTLPDDSVSVTSPWLVPAIVAGAAVVGGVALVAIARHRAS
jgi:hypothetical protein